MSESEDNAETPPDGGGADTDPDTLKREVPDYEIPSLEAVKRFWMEEGLTVSPAYYYNYHRANGWTMGKDHRRIKDWQAHLRAWDARDRERAAASPSPKGNEVRKYEQDLQRRRGKKH